VSVWAVVVAAGSGSRFGGEQPKQYLMLGDRRVLDWSIAAARAGTDGVVLVVAPERAGDPEPTVDVVVAGGDTRSASVRAGLAALPADCDVVAIHDGARPVATADLYRVVVAGVREGVDGAVPGVPVTDTVKRVDRGAVVETIDRDALVAVQTPQAVRVDALRRAHASGADATDDAALIEAAGGVVVVVPGDLANTKLTHARDLPALAAVLKARSAAETGGSAGAAGPAGGGGSTGAGGPFTS
jgi:2-C-methyl-D-erythritol 4-phosphate cytidylyltransferase